ncbi:MAG: hypothetical protein JJD96_05515 [Thermoleophilia bacterium]|nr:hypothetical protein [Thermoleophilia bacterium]
MTGSQAETKWLRMLEDAGEIDLIGFTVEALDGIAGRIEQMLYWTDARTPDYLVVDMGRWPFGHKSVLSVRMIEDLDTEKRSLRIGLSKRQIRTAPEFLPST